jgi:hypothetical protein
VISGGPRLWPFGIRQALAAAAIALAAACSPAPDRPAALPGSWLSDLDSVDCSAIPLISSSSDGRWIAFWLSYFRPDAGLSLPIQSPALLEWQTRELVLPAGPADRVTGPSFDSDSLCWDDRNQQLFVQAGALSPESPRSWFSVALQSGSGLVPTGPPPENCRRPAPQQWQWHRPATDRPELRRGLEITRRGCCELVLSSADGNVLAVHEAQREFSDPLLITRFAWSPDGQTLAYTLSEQVSWRFALPSPSFVISRGSTPKRLDAEIFSLAWYDDEHLIGCTANQRPGGGNALKVWRIDAD